MVVELTVTIRDEDRTHKKKFLLYETFSMDCDDPVIKRCIAETLVDFSGDPSLVRIRCCMDL